MTDDDLLILRGEEVEALTAGREREVLAAVRAAYLAHGRGDSSLPHSTFLRFPGDGANRIIALPAYVGDGFERAGMKWIASFPHNRERGLARASAVIVLNSCATGRPQAILEGSLISAQRTAASAALAAAELSAGRSPSVAGLVGAGRISAEIARFLPIALPTIERFVVFDLDRHRAEHFAEHFAGRAAAGDCPAVEVADDLPTVLAAAPLTAFATTAVEPHVDDLSVCPADATILHVSLRDLTPRAILASDNVVDDPDHVCRAATSVHLAEQHSGGRGFIRCSLAEILAGEAPPRAGDGRPVVFSPFGLGVLDLAVADLVVTAAAAAGVGTAIERFLPAAEADPRPAAQERAAP